MAYLAYAAAWIATAVAVIYGIKYTGSAWCLWAFVLPVNIRLSLSGKYSDDDDGEEDEEEDE